MLRVLLVLGGVLAAVPAWAGCNYYPGDGAKAEICLSGKCEAVVRVSHCSNVDSADAGFEVKPAGETPPSEALWHFHWSEQGVRITRAGTPVDAASVVCKDVDEDACFKKL